MLGWISEGLRIFSHSVRVKAIGVKRYKGDKKEICRRILDECWNGKYIQTSAGHFSQFYIRDFAYFIDSHIKLGYKDRVMKTLSYALDKFSKQKLTTTLTPKGKAIDVFNYAPDSLALLIYSLRVAKANDLINKYQNFLNKEIRRFYNMVLDKEKGIVKANIIFSSIKDNAIRHSSMYNNCMLGLLADELKKIKILDNPFKKYNFRKNIKKYFWTGEYFKEDLNSKVIAGDANTFPFWTGLFTDKKMFKICLNKMQEEKLDKPFPLRYTNKRYKEKHSFIDKLVPNYEGDSCWIHLGLCFIDVIKRFDKKLLKQYLDEYSKNILQYRNFLEIFNKNGKPFKTLFYHSDESMSWCAKYLELIKRK
jgi:hypothetical protein